MKNHKWFLALALGVLASGAPVAVGAASGPGDATNNLTNVSEGYEVSDVNTPASADSTAQFDVKAGTLALLAVPNLHFESKSVADLIHSEQTLRLDSAAVAPNTNSPAFDGNNDESIKVQDYRGTNGGWQLTAKLGDFTGKKVITPSQIQIKGSVSGDNTKSLAVSESSFVGEDTAILSAPEGDGTGVNEAKIDAGSLTLPQDREALFGTYQATINWSLSAVPETPEPTGPSES